MLMHCVSIILKTTYELFYNTGEIMRHFLGTITIILFLLSGCALNNKIESLNGESIYFWVDGVHKQKMKQWIGHDIQKLLSHPDFLHGKHSKTTLSPHIDFYIVQSSMWCYTDKALKRDK